MQLSGGYLPWLWYRSEALSLFLDAHIGWYSHSEIGVTIIFFVLDGAKDTVLGLPFSLYRSAPDTHVSCCSEQRKLPAHV